MIDQLYNCIQSTDQSVVVTLQNTTYLNVVILKRDKEKFVILPNLFQMVLVCQNF
jgi:hypothetical protein